MAEGNGITYGNPLVDKGVATVPPYSPPRPYPTLEPLWEPTVIKTTPGEITEVETIPPCTIYQYGYCSMGFGGGGSPGNGGGDTGACAPTMNIVISGLAIRTDCIPSNFSHPGLNGVQYNDVAMNGSLVLPVYDLTEWCGDLSTPAGCIWDRSKFNAYHYHVCDGLPFNEADEDVLWTVAHMDNTWYVMGTGGLGSGNGVFFYAQASSITAPFHNYLTAISTVCNAETLPSSRFMDVWWGDCTLGSGNYGWTFNATSGIVTVTA